MAAKTERVHCARLLNLRDSLIGKQILQGILDLAEPNESCYEIIKNIVDLCQDHDGLFFQVQREGLPESATTPGSLEMNSRPMCLISLPHPLRR